MRSNVAVIVVHGIRTESAGYSHRFREEVTRYLGRGRAEFVEWREVFWGDVTHGNQQAYFESAKAKGWFKWLKTRWELVIQGLGDAAAYIRTDLVEETAYHRIQTRVSDALDELDLPDRPERMLVFIGHSLGCQIISSYVWDANKNKNAVASADSAGQSGQNSREASPFRRLETLAGIVTLGTNIPLFTFAFSPKGVVPITSPRNTSGQAAFPGTRLSPDKAAKAKWINFYSPYDLLGYPLKPLNPEYDRGVASDFTTILGSGLMFWHPARAHSGYWRSPTVIKHTANLLKDLVG